MQISIRPRPEVTVRPEIRVRRPPDEYIDLLAKSELEFRKYISEIESDPLFKRLQSEGNVAKIHFKGRIPYHIYQEFRDKEFIAFLERYNITSKADWESDFFDNKAVRKIKDLSARYKAPRGELVKALEYCRHLKLSWNGDGKEDFISFFSFDDSERFRQPEARDLSVQSDESLANLANILEKYSVSEVNFVECFLSGNAEPFDIARNLNIDVNVVEDIIEAVEKVQMMSAMQVNMIENYDKPYGNPDMHPVAAVRRFKNPPRAEIQVDANEQYGSRYRIEVINESISKDELLFIDKLKMINQRRDLTVRIIEFIYTSQYPYFVSGNELHLKPLSQAQIAKEAGEHEPTVYRTLRDKFLETPEGILPLKFFCQSKGDVIKRIIHIREEAEIESGMRRKPFSDAEIAGILAGEYHTKVSRRTVTYYRNKVKKLPKFYARMNQYES